MTNTKHMTEEKAFTQDVKTMSYEELMDSIRYLDAERKKLAPQDNEKSKIGKRKTA